MKVRIKKLHPDAKEPTYGTPGAGAFDLYATNEGSTIPCFVAKTDLAFEVPLDHTMLLFSRSGHGFKNNVRLANCVGVIDSDYRGEVMVKLTHDGDNLINPFYVKKGDRIAQGIIIETKKVQFILDNELSETSRVGGFGSTGR